MKYIILALLLASCANLPVTTPPAPEEVPPVVETPVVPEVEVTVAPPLSVVKKPANCKEILLKTSACPVPGTYTAFDISFNGDQKFYDMMACMGYNTAIRYYDWYGHESLRGKIPKDAEIKILTDMGWNLVLVFQHNNRPYSTFADTIGEDRYNRDPNEILFLANKWKQPKGSLIILGVDNDAHYKDPGRKAVRTYFAKIGPKLKAAGYLVGMYGSGANCDDLAAKGLIDKIGGKPACMIAGSSGWSGTKQTIAAGRYILQQKVNQSCNGYSLDYDKANIPYFGQWAPKK